MINFTIRSLVNILVFVTDVLYQNRPYQRFYVLETIARVPYFAYLSVLHLYETLGFWRKADWLKVHFAETWNELHHHKCRKGCPHFNGKRRLGAIP